MKLIRDKKDNSTFEALDFGGPKVYQVDNTWVYAPEGGISLTKTATDVTLEPLGLTVNLTGGGDWSVISHQNIGTCNWRATVKNNITLEEISGVYPFNLEGNVYQLPCGGNEWVIASCGGYEIESTWSGQASDECYRLKGTGELMYASNISSIQTIPVQPLIYSMTSHYDAQNNLYFTRGRGYWDLSLGSSPVLISKFGQVKTNNIPDADFSSIASLEQYANNNEPKYRIVSNGSYTYWTSVIVANSYIKVLSRENTINLGVWATLDYGKAVVINFITKPTDLELFKLAKAFLT